MERGVQEGNRVIWVGGGRGRREGEEGGGGGGMREGRGRITLPVSNCTVELVELPKAVK